MFSVGANWFELSLFPLIPKGINACWVSENKRRRSHQVYGMHYDPRTVFMCQMEYFTRRWDMEVRDSLLLKYYMQTNFLERPESHFSSLCENKDNKI